MSARFRERIVIVTAASIEVMNNDDEGAFGRVPGIRAPWDPRALAAEFADYDVADLHESWRAAIALHGGSTSDRHAETLNWARALLDALWPGVSSELLQVVRL